MEQASVLYYYNPERAKLEIVYDAQANIVTIRGGKHGFARLAEAFSFYAVADSEADHEHWALVQPAKTDFEIAFVPHFEKELL